MVTLSFEPKKPKMGINKIKGIADTSSYFQVSAAPVTNISLTFLSDRHGCESWSLTFCSTPSYLRHYDFAVSGGSVWFVL